MSDPNLRSTHGFFMLGTTDLVLYHSVRFHMPAHAFQMILLGSLPPDAMAAYARDVAAHAGDGSVWLLHNKDRQFALQDLVDGTVRTFVTDIKRLTSAGYQTPNVANDVTLTVGQILYFRALNPSDNYNTIVARYIDFGTANGSYLAHYLTKDPDYDALAVVDALKDGTITAPYAKEVKLLMDYKDGPPLPAANPLKAGGEYFRPSDAEHHPNTGGDIGIHPPPPPGPTPSYQVKSAYWFDPSGINEQ